MDRRKKRDQPFPVHSRLKRQVDAHHAYGEDIDEHVHERKHLRNQVSRLTRNLIVYRAKQSVLTRLPHFSERRESRDETVYSRLPVFDVLRKNRYETPRLLDNRRNQKREKAKQRRHGSE